MRPRWRGWLYKAMMLVGSALLVESIGVWLDPDGVVSWLDVFIGFALIVRGALGDPKPDAPPPFIPDGYPTVESVEFDGGRYWAVDSAIISEKETRKQRRPIADDDPRAVAYREENL